MDGEDNVFRHETGPGFPESCWPGARKIFEARTRDNGDGDVVVEAVCAMLQTGSLKGVACRLQESSGGAAWLDASSSGSPGLEEAGRAQMAGNEMMQAKCGASPQLPWILLSFDGVGCFRALLVVCRACSCREPEQQSSVQESCYLSTSRHLVGYCYDLLCQFLCKILLKPEALQHQA